MIVELSVVCGNTCIRAKVKSHNRQHLNDLLYDNSVEYTNRSDDYIDIYIDDARDGHKLSQILRWLGRATT